MKFGKKLNPAPKSLKKLEKNQNNLAVDQKKDKILQKTIKYISYRMRSEKEIIDYLKKKIKNSNSEKLIKEIIKKLKHFNLLNDKEFAEQWISSKTKKGKGPRVIEFELFKKGINKEDTSIYLSKISNKTWLENAKKILEKKMFLWKKDQFLKKKQKAYRLLLSRGFPLEIVRKAIDATLDKR